ncbi:MAG TPA: C40 family peptidase [Candidatus Acidoferrales bacterium]|nr:C40 family peptidase [Candidatus Acidoferrales bacterium]
MARQCSLILFFTFVLFFGPKYFAAADAAASHAETVRTKLVKMARRFLGLPYIWGGMSERRGADCSGLVKIIFGKLRIQLPRTSREQIASGESISADSLKAGDLVFFSSDGTTPNHVGVYLGENRFLHAEKRAGRVIVTDLNQPWYVKHFLGARRVLGGGKSESPTESMER